MPPATNAIPASAPAAKLVGPVNPTTFLEEQQHRRRATWKLAAASVAGVALMGIPVSFLVTPLVYGALLVVADVVTLVHPVPAIDTTVSTLARVIASFMDRLGGNSRAPMPVPALLFWTTAAVALLGPGVAVMTSLWLGLRALFHRAGVGGLLLRLGARAARADDPEERRLQNVTDEMAIAAGLQPPRLVIIDAAAPNAAVIGSSADDAALVVSRRLLDEFDREETQAVVGHLVGSIGNGDLRIAFTIMSVFQAFGLLVAIIDAPLEPRSRRLLWQVVRLIVGRRDSDAAEAALIEELLSTNTFAADADTGRSSPSVVWLPLVLLSVAVKWTLFVFTDALVGPLLALLWRTRCYLADATAVQLTRDPDAVASSLVHIGQDRTAIPGSEAASYLFVVKPGTMAAAGEYRGGHTTPSAGRDAAGLPTFLPFEPSLARRLAKLRAEGAHFAGGGTRSPRPAGGGRIIYLAFVAFVGVLVAVALAAAFAGVALFVGVSLFFVVGWLAAIHAIFHLLRWIRDALLK